MLRKFNVSFTSESGVDGGGLTTDMYSQFFTQVFDPRLGLFEAADEASETSLMLPSPSNPHLDAFGNTFYPLSHSLPLSRSHLPLTSQRPLVRY